MKINIFTKSDKLITEQELLSGTFSKEPVFFADKDFVPHLIHDVNVCKINDVIYTTDILLNEKDNELWHNSLRGSPGYESRNFFEIDCSDEGWLYLKSKLI